MAHHNTVSGQLLTLLPRHEFDAEAARPISAGTRLRVMSRWAQFVALGLGQLASRQSLRDIVSNLRAQPAKLYHLGVRTVSRSSLARVNAEQPYTLYEALFGRLPSRCQQRAPGHGFRFRHKLYAVRCVDHRLVSGGFPRGRRSAARRPRSSCTSGWTKPATCRVSSASPMARPAT